jgi:ParB-like chromosome segregation protein Spo0J
LKKNKQAAKTAKPLKIEMVDVASLVSDPSNVRRHGDKNLNAIKGSLTKFGQQKPIVVDSKNIVIAGNGTLAAAKALGWKSLVVVRTDLVGVDAAAFAIADNRTAELAEWDMLGLGDTLKSLIDSDFDISSIGFEKNYLDKLLESPSETPGVQDKTQFLVVLECENEIQQRDLYEEFTIRELKCKLL